MSALSRRWIATGAILAAIGVGLGAYGAHGLTDTLARAGFAPTASKAWIAHAVDCAFDGPPGISAKPPSDA